MKIIFFGTPHFVIPVLDVLLKQHDVIAIVTAPDKKGRYKKLIPSPVNAAYQQYCEEPLANKYYPPRIFTPHKLDEQTAKELSLLKPDLFVVAAYGKLIPKKFLEIPIFGAINIHPSLLPQYRGPSPITQTLLDGQKITGVTIIKMDEALDHGPILATASYEIHPTDTFETLANHLFHQAAEMLPHVIADYTSGTITPQSQNHEKATYTKLITKEDGYFAIDNPPEKEKLDRMIRAYYPWPTAWTTVKIKNNELRIKVLPGGKLQPEGKNPMSIKDFINGYPELKNVTEKLFEK